LLRTPLGNPEPARMPKPNDRELVDQARKGDAQAFGTLVRRYQRRIFRLAFHLVRAGAEAEDVTQETFVRAYQALDRFDGRSEPFTWLYRIAVNLSLNSIRARKSSRASTPSDDPRIEAMLTETRPSAGRDPAMATQQREMAAALCDGIDALSDTLRTTLILVCIDGVAHDDASKILGCPEGTVAWRVHEARRKLREYLADRGFGDSG
jgi:RNA polymerase sigma-70 factor, ECF subfamily